MPLDQLTRALDGARDATTCRAIARGLAALADAFSGRAEQLEISRRNARLSLNDYAAFIRAAHAAQVLMALGIEREHATKTAANRYRVPEDAVAAHLRTLEAREKRAEADKRRRAAKDMAARRMPQTAIARALGVTQPRVSQLIGEAGSARAP